MAYFFISYRREDAGPQAGRLHDILTNRLGRGQIFMDLNDIPPGQQFLRVIEKEVAACKALLALIGPRWIAIADEHGRQRLSDPTDVLRMEIVAALKAGIPVVPVLVDGAVMPRKADLPAELAALTDHQAFEITERHFQRDADVLLNALPASLVGTRRRSRIARAAGVAILVLCFVVAVWWAWHRGAPSTGTTISGPPPVSVPAPTAPTTAPLPDSESTTAQANETANGGRKRDEMKPKGSPAVPRVNIEGVWRARVKYGRLFAGGEPYWEEEYVFESAAGELIGTATMLETPHPIQNAQIKGRNLYFSVYQTMVTSGKEEVRELKYRGVIEGNTIQFVHQDMRTARVVRFTATRMAK